MARVGTAARTTLGAMTRATKPIAVPSADPVVAVTTTGAATGAVLAVVTAVVTGLPVTVTEHPRTPSRSGMPSYRAGLTASEAARRALLPP